MKRLKRIMALVIAMAMVLGMTSMAWAEEPRYDGNQNYDTEWSGTADAKISVSGLQEGDVVHFYKVLDYDQNAANTVANAAAMTTNGTDWGAASWKVIAPFTDATTGITLQEFKDILTTGISSELAGKIAKLATGATTINETANDEGLAEHTFTTSETPAGLYVAIIEPAVAGMMYNPIFVASDYYTTTGGDKSSTWEVVATPLSYSDEAMAKVSTVSVEKTANDTNTVDKDGSRPASPADAVAYDPNSETVNVGDTVDFKVETKIPEFGSNYVNASYVVTDTLSNGLQLLNADGTGAASATDYSIKVEIKAAAADGDDTADTDYTEIKTTDTFAYFENGTAKTGNPFTVTASATGYTITFNKFYLLNQIDALTDLKITYKAKVLDSAAAASVNEEDNTVVVSFNNNPNDANSKTKLIDKTNHYTFDIDADLLGKTVGQWPTSEVVKVGLDQDGNEITQETTTLHTEQGDYGPLAGAKFKLYKANAAGTDKGDPYTNSILTAEDYIVSGNDGRLNIYDVSEETTLTGIKGLDAGTYFLEETEAPAGYIKHQDLVKIEIIPTFKEVTEQIDDDNDSETPALEVKVKELVSYKVLINGNETANYTLTNDVDGDALSATEGDNVTGAHGYINKDNTDPKQGFGKITNTRGTELPSTGGIGTTIFYVVGAILVIGAGVILITRRRMDA